MKAVAKTADRAIRREARWKAPAAAHGQGIARTERFLVRIEVDEEGRLEGLAVEARPLLAPRARLDPWDDNEAGEELDEEVPERRLHEEQRDLDVDGGGAILELVDRWELHCKDLQTSNVMSDRAKG